MRRFIRPDVILVFLLFLAGLVMARRDGWMSIAVACLGAVLLASYLYRIFTGTLPTDRPPITRARWRLALGVAVLALPVTGGLILALAGAGLLTEPVQRALVVLGLFGFVFALAQVFRPRVE